MEDAANNPGLVADCEALLAVRDILGRERDAELVGEKAHCPVGRRLRVWITAAGYFVVPAT